MTKRNPRASVGWMLFCGVVPIVGGVFYLFFGVNRIRTKAAKWKKRGLFDSGRKREYDGVCSELARAYPDHVDTVSALIAVSDKVSHRPLLPGNRVEPLFNGDNAYPRMIEAIGNAEKTVYLCTYLFDSDELGMKFVDALGATAARGVDVRVIVDAVGERYSRGSRVGKYLAGRQGVRFAPFLPLAFSPRSLAINLRLHRKILIVDSEIGFTGGMNIGGQNLVEDDRNDHKISDLHFQFHGPVVYEMEDVFLEDWYFCTREMPELPPPTAPAEPAGTALCRGISDGPNEDYEVLTWILVGAIGVARERVQIMTPYFLPSDEILSALNAAVLRGVRVDVILPESNNVPVIAWAAQDRLQDVLEHGVRVYYQPDPFSHTKLLLMDDRYVLLGSANMDPRSLRLNFEFNVEVYDPALARQLSQRFDDTLARSREVTREELAKRGFFTKLRDSVAKLLSPYL